MCDEDDPIDLRASLPGRARSPSRSRSPSPQPTRQRRRSVGAPMQNARRTAKHRHWLPCKSCCDDPIVEDCVLPETESFQQKCEHCRANPTLQCDSSVWMEPHRLKVYMQCLEEDVDIEEADRQAFGDVDGLLGGPLDRCKEYSFLQTPSPSARPNGRTRSKATPRRRSRRHMARGSSPSLNGDSTNDSGIILKSKSPAGNEVANVASSSRMTLLSQTARPARPARPSQPAASTKAEQLASPPMKMQKYFYKDEYHNVPLVPVMDDEGRRKLFNDVRRVMIEKSIDKELLGDSASRAEILELHEKYDDVLWQALGI